MRARISSEHKQWAQVGGGGSLIGGQLNRRSAQSSARRWARGPSESRIISQAAVFEGPPVCQQKRRAPAAAAT